MNSFLTTENTEATEAANSSSVASVLSVVSTLLLLTATPVPALELSLDAGSLRATVSDDPWRVTFTDAEGQPVLHEASDLGVGPSGPLGFRTAAGWVHALRASALVRTAHGIAALVDTTDARGRQLAVRLTRDADGVIELSARIEGGATDDVEALGIGFAASPDERFFGFGERANAVEHRGSVVESYVSDGPYDPSDRDLIRNVLPPPGYRERDDATYFPIPWLLSSRGYGVLVDNDETAYHRLASERPDAWSVEVVGAPIGVPMAPAPAELALRVFAGPTPADVLRRFTARVGRQPRAAAPWVFGPWYQPGGSVAAQVAQLEALRAADAPVSVAQTYFHYLPCGGSRAAEPQRTAAMHALGVAVTTYFNPMLCEEYRSVFEPAVASGALMRTADGEPYIYRYVTSRVFRVGQFDFTAPAGRVLYRELLRDAIADGHDGWMEDFGEYTPLDSYTRDGRDGTKTHNRYAVDYHCTAFALTRTQERPIVRFQRSGWTGAARCAQVVWSGDPTSQWGFDGLASVVTTGLGMGLSGISTWGSDIGGFFGFFGKHLSGEMLARWVQLGALTGVMRTQRDGLAIPEYARPQVDDPDQLANWRRWAKFRTQLYPYLAAAESVYRCTGLPMMRHLLLHWPDDPEAVRRDDQYLFGPDLLIAPVLAPDVAARDAYLPPGAWIDLWRAVAYDPEGGGLVLGAAEVVDGGQTVTVPAPADELPIFVRSGTVLPLLPSDVDTLADYGAGAPGVVRLADRLDRLELVAFPRGTSSARAFRGERYRSIEGDGSWELELKARRARTWTLQASLATLEQPFTPCAVAFADTELPAGDWSFDAASGVLRATFAGQRGRLVVRGGCAGDAAPPPKRIHNGLHRLSGE
jgi:alpha-glucosidase (family GH31 glycosyl hydrolase)